MIVSVVFKWVLEHSVLVRAGAATIAAIVFTIWIYHTAVERVQQKALISELETVMNLKEKYDEISNHRPDNRGVIDLLHAGTF